VEFSDGEFIAAGADGQVIDSIVEKIDINGETYLKCMVVGNELSQSRRSQEAIFFPTPYNLPSYSLTRVHLLLQDIDSDMLRLFDADG